MSWREANSLLHLRDQVNALWPDRSKDSDGTIGDASHSARLSDHNPDGAGVVHAMDITHDPAHGFDSYAFADELLKAQDTRLKYVISNRRIGSGPRGPAPGTWRPYHGINPHDHHVHISVVECDLADLKNDWIFNPDNVRMSPSAVALHVSNMAINPVAYPTLRLGANNASVRVAQSLLHRAGYVLDADGTYGAVTAKAIAQFQKDKGLIADGICGPQTWKALLA